MSRFISNNPDEPMTAVTYHAHAHDDDAAAAIHAIQIGHTLSLAYLIRTPVTPRGWLLLLVIALYLALVLTTSLVMSISRFEAAPIASKIADYVLPGNPLPDSATCDYGDAHLRYLLYCSPSPEEPNPAEFTYDERAKVITNSSAPISDGTTIGDLILAWGSPIGYRREEPIIKVFWSKRAALVSASLYPTNNVSAIFYYPYLCPQSSANLRTWQGFVSVDRAHFVSAEALKADVGNDPFNTQCA